MEDPEYTSQRNYPLETPCILDVSPQIGPDQLIPGKGKFSSFRVYEMPFDSFDRERKGLFTRHFYKTIAPWTTENPIFMHLTSSDPAVVRTAVDQCAETGYEMIILSFGSGANAEDISEENIAKIPGFPPEVEVGIIYCRIPNKGFYAWLPERIRKLLPDKNESKLAGATDFIEISNSQRNVFKNRSVVSAVMNFIDLGRFR